MATEDETREERESETRTERERVALERERPELEEAQARRAERERQGQQAQFWDRFRGEDNGTVWIIVALIIFLIDISPFGIFGERYSGFIFTFWNLTEINVISIVTHSLFITLLLINILFRFFHKDYSFLPLLGLLFVLNYSGNLLGAISYNAYYNYIAVAAIIVLFFIIKHFKRTQDVNLFSQEDIAYLIFIFVYSFLLLNAGWIYEWKAIIHFVFITAFGFLFIRAKENSEQSWYYLTILLLLIDFFGYNLLKNVVAFRFLPFLFFFVVIYAYAKTQNKWATILGTIMFGMMIIVSLDDINAQGGFGQFGYIKAERPLSATERFLGIGKKLSTYIERQLEYATGGLYRSQVEKNQFEPLGVYFDRIRAAQPKFYTDEDVTLWSTIKSRTLSDPVTVNFTCFRWKSDNTRIKVDNDDKIIPDKPFKVYTLEEKDVECTFAKGKLLPGTDKITLSATYNFVTNAYQKVYFINKNRYRAMIRENIDPLKEFGITDLKLGKLDEGPAVVYTNGPVEIAVSMQKLIPIGNEEDVKPALGILLKNRNEITDKQGKPVGKWEGKIKKITELVIVLPNGVTIDTTSCRPVEFKEFTKEDCSRSCQDIILLPCLKACGEFDITCASDCADYNKKCVEECDSLFKAETQNTNYNGYQLNVEELYKRTKDEYKDIERFKTFVCRLKTTSDALENVPITTKFIRIRARYDYLLENTFNVLVEQAPSSEEIGVPDFNSQITDQKYAEIYYNRANKNEEKYSPLVLETAKKYNVDYLFVKAIIQVESQWNPSALGDSGSSAGLMQISPTAASGCSSDYRTNPNSNVDCGVKYIRSLIDIQNSKNIKSNLRNIAAAYNCGPKAMDSDSTYELLWKNPDSCWSKDRTTNSRIYVQKVMNVYNNLINQLNINYISKDETKPVTQISTLINPSAIYDSKEKKVLIRWDYSSLDPNVKKYLITRYYQGNSQDSYETQQTYYYDANVLPGLEYWYLIQAIDDNYNIYASAETNKIVIPATS